MVDGMKIRSLRESAELSVSEFARRIYVTQPYISGLEAGYKQPTISVLERIADYFGVKVDDLLKRDSA